MANLLIVAVFGLLTSPTFVYANEKVDFRLYPSHDPNTFDQFNLDSYGSLTFDLTKRYIILCHGWIADFNEDWYNQTIKEFASSPDIVVITGGYKEAMSSLISGFLNIKPVGEKIGKMILALNSKGVQLTHIEVVGHSFGAHIAGVAGNAVFKATNMKIRRIFGLDPAVTSTRTLCKEDAEKVVVIHTSSLGNQGLLGHVDFYPNGGKDQGGCGEFYDSNHVVSTYYFFSSINDNSPNMGYSCPNFDMFKKKQCDGNAQALMGYGVSDTATPGSYYLYVTCSEKL